MWEVWQVTPQTVGLPTGAPPAEAAGRAAEEQERQLNKIHQICNADHLRSLEQADKQ